MLLGDLTTKCNPMRHLQLCQPIFANIVKSASASCQRSIQCILLLLYPVSFVSANRAACKDTVREDCLKDRQKVARDYYHEVCAFV